jgi:hypothetical protein
LAIPRFSFPFFSFGAVVFVLLGVSGLGYAFVSGDWIGTTFSFVIHLTGVGGLLMFVGAASETNPKRAWLKLLLSAMVVFMCWVCLDLLQSAWVTA